VTTDGQGAWVAVWHSEDSLGDTIGRDFDILVARSTDDGVTWTAPAALNANAASDDGEDRWPQVTTDGQGAWVAVWISWDPLGDTIGRDADILVARSTDDGVTWSAPAALNANASTDMGHDGGPQVTTDGQGAWSAVWHSDDPLGDTNGIDFDILVAHSTDDGATWTAPAALNANAASDAADDTRPQLTTDAQTQAAWVAVWGFEVSP
jgi:Neuraminidase (sialidase)